MKACPRSISWPSRSWNQPYAAVRRREGRPVTDKPSAQYLIGESRTICDEAVRDDSETRTSE